MMYYRLSESVVKYEMIIIAYMYVPEILPLFPAGPFPAREMEETLTTT